MNDTKLTYNATELAEILGVSKPVAYSLMHSKGFPTIRIGKRMLVNASMLQSWLDANSGE